MLKDARLNDIVMIKKSEKTISKLGDEVVRKYVIAKAIKAT